MKRIILTAALLFASLIYGQSTDPPSNYGDSDAGTSANPYRIATLNNLYWISDQVNNSHNLFTGKYFIQTGDIDAASFTPIGNDSYPFKGNYDGQNHVINSLYIHYLDYVTRYIGLFGCTDGSSISNLGLTNVSINALSGIQGALCGSNNGSITNCYSAGSYVMNGSVSGGLIGQNMGGNITNCYSTVPMQSTTNYTGGLIGALFNGNVINCYYNGLITPQLERQEIGGLVGTMFAGTTITYSYSNGTITCLRGNTVGGLVGLSDGGNISYSYSSCNINNVEWCAGGFYGRADASVNDCYATGNITSSVVGLDDIGGFVVYGNTFTNCYSIGSVPHPEHYGGFSVYSSYGSVTNCFYNTDVVATSADGTGKTTAQMKDQATYTGWDFTNTWAINASINNGYPYLIQKTTIAGANVLSSGITPGTSMPVISLAFSEVLGMPYITSIRVDRTGTATDIDIPSASLWIDNNKDNVIDTDRDVQLGTTQSFSSGTLTFSGLNYWPCTINNLVIVYNAAPDANTSSTAGASILSNYITGTIETVITFGGVTTGSEPLPVELTSFIAAVEQSIVQLNWQTATEVNNYGFEIERSIILSGAKNLNAIGGTSHSLSASWETLGFVEGNGNSNSIKNYSFTDDLTLNHNLTLNYRLKQIDIDGSFTYSQEVEVKAQAEEMPTEFALYQNYPNPFNPSTTIKYSIPGSVVNTHRDASQQFVSLKVFDILGNEVATLVNEPKEPGSYSVEWNASRFASGIYFYKISAGNFTSVKKLMLMK